MTSGIGGNDGIGSSGGGGGGGGGGGNVPTPPGAGLDLRSTGSSSSSFSWQNLGGGSGTPLTGAQGTIAAVEGTIFLTFDISAGPASFTLPTSGLSNGSQFDCTYSGEGTANTLTVTGPALSGTGTGIDSSTYNAMVSEWVGTGTGRVVFTWNPLLGDGGGLWVQT
jgi:hypothetical protein